MDELTTNPLLYSGLGNLDFQLNEYNRALENFNRARKFSDVSKEQSVFKKNIETCRNRNEMSHGYSLEKSF